jgi:hypothetical protein
MALTSRRSEKSKRRQKCGLIPFLGSIQNSGLDPFVIPFLGSIQNSGLDPFVTPSPSWTALDVGGPCVEAFG